LPNNGLIELKPTELVNKQICQYHIIMDYGENTNYMLEVVKEDGIMEKTHYKREHCVSLFRAFYRGVKVDY
jgi:hypothetical protein